MYAGLISFNEQRATSNEQRATSNEQRATGHSSVVLAYNKTEPIELSRLLGSNVCIASEKPISVF